MSSRGQELVWERGWEGHEKEQLRRLAELSLAEKIRRLEEAQRLVRRLSRPSPDPVRKSRYALGFRLWALGLWAVGRGQKTELAGLSTHNGVTW